MYKYTRKVLRICDVGRRFSRLRPRDIRKFMAIPSIKSSEAES